MISDIDGIQDLWLSVKGYIPKKDRLDAADAFVIILDEYGVTDGIEYEEFIDPDLKVALVSYYGLDENEDDEDNNW